MLINKVINQHISFGRKFKYIVYVTHFKFQYFELTSFTMDKYSKKTTYRFYIEEIDEYTLNKKNR